MRCSVLLWLLLNGGAVFVAVVAVVDVVLARLVLDGVSALVKIAIDCGSVCGDSRCWYVLVLLVIGVGVDSCHCY